MKRIYKYIFIFILILCPGFLYSQDCTHYHVENCRWADRTYLYSRQSRSALFTSGMRSEFRIIVYSGEQYYISVNGHRNLGNIRLRIFDDDDEKPLLYDNAEYSYESFFYFQNSRTRDLIIEITTEETDSEKEAKEKYCLGVLIEFRNITISKESKKPGVGF